MNRYLVLSALLCLGLTACGSTDNVPLNENPQKVTNDTLSDTDDSKSDNNNDTDNNTDNTDNNTDKDCEKDTYGPDCMPVMCKHGIANEGKNGDGACSRCNEGWDGDYCDNCTDNRYGDNCQNVCSCNGDQICNSGITGEGCISSTMQDIAGNSYPIVKINNQIWMAKNMNFNGTDTVVVDCRKDSNNSRWTDDYGCLYNMTDADKVCPGGWHLPTTDDWNTLIVNTNAYQNSDSILHENYSKSNSSGFSTLLAGCYSFDNTHGERHEYVDFGSISYFWDKGRIVFDSFTVHPVVVINYTNGGVVNQMTKSEALWIYNSYFSVRCIKD